MLNRVWWVDFIIKNGIIWQNRSFARLEIYGQTMLIVSYLYFCVIPNQNLRLQFLFLFNIFKTIFDKFIQI